MSTIQVETLHGIVEGVRQDGGARFHAVPYAAPPFGPRRFRPPSPPLSWPGVRDCTRIGPGAPQPWLREDPWDRLVNPQQQGEDCLTLDITTPDTGAAGRPVMVWIHGGGFLTGTGSAPVFHGGAFARDGIVHVSVNYRLGIDGWCHFGGAPDNRGLRDQVAALGWVRDNIAAFGGDPGNVTVAGQSSGAISVGYLLASPAARGLFRRAICQSGILDASVPAEMAREVTRRTAVELGVEPTPEAFAGVGLDRLRAVVQQMAIESTQAFDGDVFWPALPYLGVHGTEMLPDPVAVALNGGAGAGIAVLAGTNRDEATGTVRKAGLLEVEAPDDWVWQASALLGIDEGLLDAYRDGPRRSARTIELLSAALTDKTFRIPTIRLLEAHRGRGHLYRFDWESPALPAGMGADHGIEVPFVYDDLAGFRSYATIGAEVLGPQPPQSLATAMHRAWVSFAATGDPGWPAYDPERRTTMRFAAESRLVDDLGGVERVAWQARR